PRQGSHGHGVDVPGPPACGRDPHGREGGVASVQRQAPGARPRTVGVGRPLRGPRRGVDLAPVPAVLALPVGAAPGTDLGPVISFRYLVVTIVSIFLALGLGVLAGTTVVDQGLVKDLRNRTHSAERAE